MKKLAALLLCLCMMLSLAACAVAEDDDVPAGMQIASVAGADYYLYVPTSWNVNTYYGISGAYRMIDKLSNVSVEKYEITDSLKAEITAAAVEDTPSARIAWYYAAHCKPILEKLAGSFGVTAVDAGSATTLGGENAMQFRVTAQINGVLSLYHHVIAERQGAFYVFTFSVDQEIFDALWVDVQDILAEFKFSDTPYQPAPLKPLEAGDAPDGMKLASNDEVAYRFYVPTSWAVNQNERIFSAYVEGDRSNVSVVPYTPAVSMSIDDYNKMTEDKLLEIVGTEGYTFIEETERTLGGRTATARRYRLTIEGKTFEYLQVVATYRGMLYSVTYTAPSEAAYNNHIAEVEQILDAFAFR